MMLTMEMMRIADHDAGLMMVVLLTAAADDDDDANTIVVLPPMVWSTHIQLVTSTSWYNPCEMTWRAASSLCLRMLFSQMDELRCLVYSASGYNKGKDKLKTSFHLVWPDLVVDADSAPLLRELTLVIFSFPDAQLLIVCKRNPFNGSAQNKARETDQFNKIVICLFGPDHLLFCFCCLNCSETLSLLLHLNTTLDNFQNGFF